MTNDVAVAIGSKPLIKLTGKKNVIIGLDDTNFIDDDTTFDLNLNNVIVVNREFFIKEHDKIAMALSMIEHCENHISYCVFPPPTKKT